MKILLIINETYTNGYKIDILDIISLLAILCGILVIISRDPAVLVLFLIGLFASIACYLFFWGFSTIGIFHYVTCGVCFLVVFSD